MSIRSHTPTLLTITVGFLFCLLALNLFSVHGDLYDGFILNYAFDIRDVSPIHFWFEASGLIRGSFFETFIVRLFEYLNLDFSIANKAFLLSVISLSIYEATQILKKISPQNNNSIQYLVVIMLCFPFLTMLSSSVLKLHFLSVYFCFLSTRLIHNEKSRFFAKIFSIIILFFSLDLKSVYCLTVSLSLIHDYIKHNRLKVSRTTIYIFLFLIFIYTLESHYIVRSWPYESYNNFLDFTKLESYSTFFHCLRNFFQTLIPTLVVCTTTLLFQRRKTVIKLINNNHTIVGLLFFLFLSSTVPYCLVGKSQALKYTNTYPSRHYVTAFIPLSILITYLLIICTKYSPKKTRSFILSIPPIVFLCFQIPGFAIIQNSKQIDKIAIKQLKSYPPPKNGTIHLNMDYSSKQAWSRRRVHYLFYQSYGKTDWWITLPRYRKLIPPYEKVLTLEKNKDISKFYIYNFSSYSNSETRMTMRVDGYKYEKVPIYIKNLLGLNEMNVEFLFES